MLFNAALGPSGWGIAVKLEQELTADGELVGILKYGHTTNGSGLYKHIATAHLLLYNPWPVLRNDIGGGGLHLG